MVEIHHLHHRTGSGRTSAVVVPAWGANIIGLAWQAEGWRWPVPVLEAVDLASVALSPTSYGAPLLAPTPGRVGTNQNGRFTWRGTPHRIAPPRHGWLRGAAWQVEEASEASLACTIRLRPDSSACTLPFDFSARHQVVLSDGRVRSRVSLSNLGDIDLPLDVGWHPYLHRTGACRVHIPAARIWELNDQPEPTPTGELPDVAGRTDFRTGRTVAPDEHWDSVFHDLQADQTGWVDSWVEAEEQIALAAGGARRMAVRRHVRVNFRPSGPGVAGVRNMQLFTPPGRNAISLEPLSSVPDALNLAARGVAEAAPNIVPPGRTSTFEIEMAISARPA